MNNKVGTVYIVGAGCGDIELLSVKAKGCIEEADCILYDRLIDPILLTYAKESCERIYVGKEKSNHSVPQTEINELLVSYAQRYTHIVRLKGGDPYVFGRGGEEACALQQAHIPFEIVPGVTSAIAGLAMAGIPVTHRDYASGFHVVSAHNKKDEVSDLDFSSMATTNDTLVFLMGLGALDHIVYNLLQAGKAKSTPIALVSHASMPSQYVFTSTLEHIMQEDYSKCSSPTIIVVGSVVNLRKQLNFFEEKPLFRKHFVIATLHATISPLYEMLSRQGATLTQVQCGRIKEYPNALVGCAFKTYTHIVFTSKRCVDMVMQTIMENNDVRMLSNVKLCAIGKQTAKQLEVYGLRADFVAQHSNSKHFFAELQTTLHAKDCMLLPKADNDHTYLQDKLQTICKVDVRPLYQTIPMDVAFPKHHVDGIIFTCAFQVHQLAIQLCKREMYETIPVYAIGPHTAAALKSYGFQTIYEADTASLAALAQKVLEEEAHV